jgi:uridine phosphorylase
LIEPSSVPILEFDPAREAMIEPSRLFESPDAPEHCVICFFKEVLEKIAADRNARVLATHHWEDGEHCLYEIEVGGRRLGFIHPAVGAPLAAGILEDVIAHGCRKFIVCGGCGVLEKQIAVGHLIVVSSAVRDEGLSYHYLPASREVQANALAVAALEATLKDQGLPYRLGKTWTTDAPYRETPAKIALRKGEGCLTVEMEAASLMAVAEFRNVVLGQILYGGDDLSGEEWADRGWVSRLEVRERLFWLAADACLRL